MPLLKSFQKILVVAGLFTSFGAQIQAQVLLTVDGKGSDGRDGSNGGYSGANAGRSTPGADGANINVMISEGVRTRGAVVIRGMVGSEGLNKEISFGNSGYIYLDARGGDGGAGGNGANGSNGMAGSTGSSGSRSSGGGRGGDGQDGEDGGHGSSGSDGGNGGAINVSVSSKDTHLLMLFEPFTEAGDGGSAGRGGSGGRGGAGGSGGRGESWSERVYRGQSCSESCSMSSNGDGTYSNSCSRSCHDVYDTEYHSTPDGPDGSRGRDGSDGRDGYAGRDGTNGKFTISVTQPNGTVKTYTKLYDLQLVNFNFSSQNDDGFYEPGEKVIVSNIQVRNNGGMETPANHEAMVYLNDNRWILSGGQKITVGKSLKPNETYTIPEPLVFTIADTRIHHPGERFRETGTIQPLSYLADVNRDFKNFDAPKTFEISYPIEITPLSAPRTLARGQSGRLFWRVQNLSTKPLGEDSPAGRAIKTWIEKMSGEAADHVNLTGTGSFSSRLQRGFMEQVMRLGPGESTIIEGEVKVADTAPFYSEVGLNLGVDLQHINREELQNIQFREFSIRISRTYEPVENADFLLITNNGTQRPEADAWDLLAKRLGMKTAVWDLSYYGYLDLSRTIKENHTLLKDFNRRTLVLLNNTIDSNDRDFVALNLLARRDFFSALTEYGTGIYVVGGDDQTLRNFVVPSFNEVKFGSIEKALTGAEQLTSLLADEARNRENFEEGKQEWFGYRLLGDYTNRYSSYDSTGYFRSEPTAQALEADAASILQKINEVYPDKSIMAVYEFDPELIKGKLGKDEWSLGKVFLRRLGGTGTGAGVALAVPEHRIHDPDFVFSLDNVKGLFTAMRFSKRVEYIDRILKERIFDLQYGDTVSNLFPGGLKDQEYMNALADSMIADISHEISVAKKKSPSLREDRNLEYELYYLRKLAQWQIPQGITPDMALGKTLTRLASGINLAIWGHDDGQQPRAIGLAKKCYERFVDVTFGPVRPPLSNHLAEYRCEQVSPTYKASSEQIAANKSFKGVIGQQVALAQQYSREESNKGSFFERAFSRDERAGARSSLSGESDTLKTIKNFFQDMKNMIFAPEDLSESANDQLKNRYEIEVEEQRRGELQ